MSRKDEDNDVLDDAGVGLSLRERGGLSTYAGLRERAVLGARVGWHGEEI